MATRPERWHAATRRAINARHDLKLRCDEMIASIEEMADDLSAPCAKLDDALVDLICVQEEYAVQSCPENLYDSRTQMKLRDVTGLDFETMRAKVSKLKNALEALSKSVALDDDFDCMVLEDARACDLPKFYGRD